MTAATMMETLSPSDDAVYVSMSDQAEEKRWQELSGYGEVIHDEYDTTADLHELGLGGPDSKV